MQKIDKQSSEEYHSNSALSRSDLFVMSKSPAHFKYALDNPSAHTPAMIFGTAFHTYVLEHDRFGDEYIIVDKLDRRTKQGKALCEEIERSGKAPLSAEDFAKIKAMCDSVFANPYAALLLSGEKEVSYYWKDEMTGIMCKCRPDCRTDLKQCSVIVDLKTCASADTETFTKECQKYGYDLQSAMYKEGVEKVEGKPHRFVFIAVEKEPPFAVNILEADELIQRKGFDYFRYYLGLVSECQKSGNWYAYNGADGKPNMLSLPPWLINDYE